MKSPKVKGIGEVVTEYGAKVMKIFKKGLLGRSLFDFYGDVKAQTFRTKESASSPSTPTDGAGGVMYTKGADGKLYYKSNEVAEVELSSHTGLSTEEVQDIAGALAATGGTKTGITVTYQDGTGDMDFVVDHDAASNFVAAEHVDWAGASAGTVHSTNIPTLNQDTTGSSASCTGNAATATSAGRIIGPTDSDVTISSDGNITFMLDDDDDETGQSFSFKNNDTEIANLSERGDLQIDGSITAKQQHFINFGINLAYPYSRFIPIGSYYLYEQSTDANPEYTTYVAPYDGKFLKALVRSEEALGNTSLTIYKVGDGTEEPDQGSTVDTKTVDIASAATSYTYTFDSDAEFSKGDAISIKIDPTDDPIAAGVVGTIVFEFDLNT